VKRARLELEQIARRYCTTAKVDSFSGATAKHFAPFGSRFLRIAIDQMRKEPQLYEQLCGALLCAGYPEDAIPFVHFRIESQETVIATMEAVGQKKPKCPSSLTLW
jgi:hypothetical protein